MSNDRPFHRTWRPLLRGRHIDKIYSDYVLDKNYAKNSIHFIRSYLLIIRDLEEIFKFVEPTNDNLGTYSIRIHELFIRSCIELEANFKAILNENHCSVPMSRMNMSTYRKINTTHHLSEYRCYIPIWSGEGKIMSPFSEWKNDKFLSWYHSYNLSKHNRYDSFRSSNVENLTMAVAGLTVLISAQFHNNDLSKNYRELVFGMDGNYHDMSDSIGGLFRIEFPDNWDQRELYSFQWNELRHQEGRFNKLNYDELS